MHPADNPEMPKTKGKEESRRACGGRGGGGQDLFFGVHR